MVTVNYNKTFICLEVAVMNHIGKICFLDFFGDHDITNPHTLSRMLLIKMESETWVNKG